MNAWYVLGEIKIAEHAAERLEREERDGRLTDVLGLLRRARAQMEIFLETSRKAKDEAASER